MSYIAVGLDISGSVQKVVNFVSPQTAQGVTSAYQAVKHIVLDPALPEVAELVYQLHVSEQRPGAPSTPGIGLKRVVTPLKTYVYVRKNPIVGYAAVGAILALPFLLGYRAGKRRRK